MDRTEDPTNCELYMEVFNLILDLNLILVLKFKFCFDFDLHLDLVLN